MKFKALRLTLAGVWLVAILVLYGVWTLAPKILEKLS